jgi:signal transduction histidine kinase
MRKFFSSIRRWWQSLKVWWQATDTKQPTIFHSARLKLTLFYLAVLLAFCLTLTLSIRGLAEREFAHEGMSERGVVRRMLFDIYSVPPEPPSDFNQYQNTQNASVKRHLDEDVILINLAALVLGGGLSYWYAGRALKPIEDAHEAQARFAADASHELRTPLASLRVENEVFLRQKDFHKQEARELIESNLEEVQRLESLAGNLLALTQYGTQTALKLAPVSAPAIVTAAIERTSKAATAKEVKVTSEVAAGNVIGEHDSLVQLLVIMLENAIKYGPANGHVSVTGGKRSGRYYMSVRDEGPGISAVDLPHIFERLYRGDKSRTGKISGYGLGLSLAKEIAAANRASIEATNGNKGAIFTVTLAAAQS